VQGRLRDSGLGPIRVGHLNQQTEQSWCLTVVTHAVVAWTTEYYGLAVAAMRAEDRSIDDEVLPHVSQHTGEDPRVAKQHPSTIPISRVVDVVSRHGLSTVMSWGTPGRGGVSVIGSCGSVSPPCWPVAPAALGVPPETA
jgi:Tn3 transposase DDE domain